MKPPAISLSVPLKLLQSAAFTPFVLACCRRPPSSCCPRCSWRTMHSSRFVLRAAWGPQKRGWPSTLPRFATAGRSHAHLPGVVGSAESPVPANAMFCNVRFLWNAAPVHRFIVDPAAHFNIYGLHVVPFLVSRLRRPCQRRSIMFLAPPCNARDSPRFCSAIRRFVERMEGNAMGNDSTLTKPRFG